MSRMIRYEVHTINVDRGLYALGHIVGRTYCLTSVILTSAGYRLAAGSPDYQI